MSEFRSQMSDMKLNMSDVRTIFKICSSIKCLYHAFENTMLYSRLMNKLVLGTYTDVTALYSIYQPFINSICKNIRASQIGKEKLEKRKKICLVGCIPHCYAV